MISRFLLFVAIVSLLGCNAEDPGPGEPLTPTSLEYTDGSPVKGDNSGVGGKRLQVVRDSAEFSGLWSEHVAAFSPMPAQPAVDFSSRLVVAAFAGRQPSGGYSMTVETVREYPEFVDVLVEFTTPGDGCAVPSVITEPHHLVTLPARDKPVVFTEVQRKADPC